jgi:hypothetical protein
MKDPKAIRELVVSNVALHDMLADIGVRLPQTIKPQQLSCPFHGADVSMSARYYPDTNSMYCFACKKSWDPISFWMQYSETKFMEASRQVAAKYRIDLSKVADIQALNLVRFAGNKKGTTVDKRKMALFVLENNLRMAIPVEDPVVAAKMLYVVANARHIEDPVKFAQITFPVAKRLRETLS